MRTLLKNKQKLHYALQTGKVPIYEKNFDGNIVYDDIDGERIPVETGEFQLVYSKPVEFLGNIAMSGGESEAAEFGLNLGDYNAVLVVDKGLVPLDETSRIWHTTKPKLNADETADEFSADYTIVKVSPSINVDRFVLKKVVK